LTKRTGLILVLLAASVTRVAVFLAARSSPRRFWSGDDRDYLPIATHLHATYLADSGRLFDLGLRRTPGYPLFVRAIYEVFGRHYAPVVAVQLVLSVATVAVTYWLASRLLPHRYALLAAAVLAVDPASIVFANQLLTETLFTFVFMLAVTQLVIAWQRGSTPAGFFAGVLLGLAILVRPVAEYAPIVLALVVLLVAVSGIRARAAVAVALVIGVVIPVGAWVVRNYEQTGVPIVSTIDGYNMLQYRAVGALVHSGQPRSLAQHDVLVRLAARVRPGDNAAEVSRAELSVGFAILREHPVGAFEDWSRGEVKLLLGPARSETSTLLTGRDSDKAGWFRALIAVDALVTAALVLGALAGFVGLAVGRIKIPELWLLVVSAAYIVVVSGGHESYSRFRVPVDPILAVLAASAVMWLRREVVSSDERP
jgi:hypothetical protein